MTEIPIAGGTAVVVAGIIIGMFRFLVQTEIQLLREQVSSQADRLAKIEVLYDEQRKEKHRLAGELGRSQMLLGIIVKLAEQCTCGALALVDDLIRGAARDAEDP